MEPIKNMQRAAAALLASAALAIGAQGQSGSTPSQTPSVTASTYGDAPVDRRDIVGGLASVGLVGVAAAMARRKPGLFG